MRRRFLKSWPALSHVCGIYPWDVDRLTVDELKQYEKFTIDYYDARRR